MQPGLITTSVNIFLLLDPYPLFFPGTIPTTPTFVPFLLYLVAIVYLH